MMMRRRPQGFTLIELLIVVAIIAILAAIAIPNFLHAQIRAKLAKVRGDHHNLAVALESYRTDNHDYPRAIGAAFANELGVLTTPIVYLTQLPKDPFKPWDVCPTDTDRDGRCMQPGDYRLLDGGNYDFVRFQVGTGTSLAINPLWWFLFSLGPDHDEEFGYSPSNFPLTHTILLQLRNTEYDPSNGIVSSGDIRTFGPGDHPMLRRNY